MGTRALWACVCALVLPPLDPRVCYCCEAQVASAPPPCASSTNPEGWWLLRDKRPKPIMLSETQRNRGLGPVSVRHVRFRPQGSRQKWQRTVFAPASAGAPRGRKAGKQAGRGYLAMGSCRLERTWASSGEAPCTEGRLFPCSGAADLLRNQMRGAVRVPRERRVGYDRRDGGPGAQNA